MLAQQIELAEFGGGNNGLVGNSAGGHNGGGTVKREFQIRLNQFFQRAGKLALLGLDELQIGQSLAGLGFLMLQGFDRQRNLEVGDVTDEGEPLRITVDVTRTDEDASLSRKIAHEVLLLV